MSRVVDDTVRWRAAGGGCCEGPVGFGVATEEKLVPRGRHPYFRVGHGPIQRAPSVGPTCTIAVTEIGTGMQTRGSMVSAETLTQAWVHGSRRSRRDQIGWVGHLIPVQYQDVR